MQRQIRRQAARHAISERTAWLVAAGPALAFAGLLVLLLVPLTREVTRWQLLGENRPVELLTFLALLAAAVLAARQAWRLRRGEPRLWVAFYALLAVGLFVVAMEEVAWGQWFLGFDTPEALEGLNQQGETTFHNVGPLQGRDELLRLAFGCAAVVGLLLHRSARFRRIAVPPLLAPTVAVIVLHAVTELVLDELATLSEPARLLLHLRLGGRRDAGRRDRRRSTCG